MGRATASTAKVFTRASVLIIILIFNIIVFLVVLLFVTLPTLKEFRGESKGLGVLFGNVTVLLSHICDKLPHHGCCLIRHAKIA